MMRCGARTVGQNSPLSARRNQISRVAATKPPTHSPLTQCRSRCASSAASPASPSPFFRVDVLARPSRAAKREAPTSIVLFDGAWTGHSGGGDGADEPPSRVALAIAERCSAAGFSVVRARLVVPPPSRPLSGPPHPLPPPLDVDGLVEELQSAFQRSGHCAMPPPVAVAPFHWAVFAQKYLESYALSALIALAPLPPAPRGCCTRWARAGKGKGKGEGEGEGPRAGGEGQGKRAGGGEEKEEEEEEDDLSALALEAAVGRLLLRAGVSASSVSGGTTTTVARPHAQLLASLASPKGGVLLEPQPVPTLVVCPAGLRSDGGKGEAGEPAAAGAGSGGGPSVLLTRAEVGETLDMHGLDPSDEESLLWVGGGGDSDGDGDGGVAAGAGRGAGGRSLRTTDAVTAELWGVPAHGKGATPGGGAGGEEDSRVAEEVATKVVSWVTARF